MDEGIIDPPVDLATGKRPCECSIIQHLQRHVCAYCMCHRFGIEEEDMWFLSYNSMAYLGIS